MNDIELINLVIQTITVGALLGVFTGLFLAFQDRI